ncbi:histidine kinase [Massilia eurypsychrophila]|uniref:histidine kinase n=1 Tax=Massilia eurypsychrophila TaxID=1485217 RepID=A0A2G8T891_9BURK|nr:GAF domain-containing sensor histidine kinase [Massilia eurypsychrophila]PIL42270.1 histidine kinase [Massilia eurypsychrophila]
MNTSISTDIASVQTVSAVPTILRVVAETTGMRFVCIARVDAETWTTCAVLDELGFGLEAGDELDIATTLCREVREGNQLIVIDKASEDGKYCAHSTPRRYGFESYISVPVYRPGGEFFGTLCALDPRPLRVSDPKVVDTLVLFADLLSRQLHDEQRLQQSESALLSAREASELREQFIAVLGHDVRTPLSSMLTGTALLRHMGLDEKSLAVVERIERSGRRISSLVDDVVDFTRGRMGAGIPLQARASTDLQQQLRHVVDELRDIHPGRRIDSDIDIDGSVFCDPLRIAQLLSNLLVNALLYGAHEVPVRVAAHVPADGGLFLSVTNGGAPMAPATLAALFQPFWRGDNSGASGGLGLGLYIVNEIARPHHGAMEVTSTADATTFSFRMPAAAPATAR